MSVAAEPPGSPGRNWYTAIVWALAQFPPAVPEHHELMAFVFWKLSARYSRNAEEIRALNRRLR